MSLSRLIFGSCTFIALICAPKAFAAPVISEVMWMGSDLSTQDEWLEIAGITTVTDLSMYKVTSVNSSGNEVTILEFPIGTTILPGETIVISRNNAEASRLIDEPDFVVGSAMTLPNTKLLLRIRDSLGNIVDTADDGVGNPIAGQNVTNPPFKASMERLDLALPGDVATNWRSAVTSLGLEEPALNVGTPGSLAGLPASSSSSSSPSSSSASSSSVLASSRSSSSESSSSSSSSSSDSSESSVSLSSLSASSLPNSSSTSSSDSSEPSESSVSSSSSSTLPSSSSNSSSSSASSDTSVSSASSSSSSSSSNSACHSLRITELLPDPTGDDAAEFIEFQNVSTNVLDLTSCTYSVKIGTTTKPVQFSQGSLTGMGYLALSYAQVGAHLPNGGGTVMLMSSDEAIDTFAYPAATEAMSFEKREGIIERSCVPSPGSNEAEWNPSIFIESGAVSGFDSVPLNIKILPGNGSLSGANCTIDFGDDSSSTTCNPSTHTYRETGEFTLSASIRNACGTTVERTLNVTVFGNSSSSSSSLSSHSSLASSNSFSSSATSLSLMTLNTKIVLHNALPNPDGSDTGKEWVEIKNTSAVSGSIDGFVLKTLKTTSRPLSGTLDAGEVRKILTQDIGLTLKNENESVSLVRPDGSVARTASWKKASDGVQFGPVSQRASVRILVTNTIDGDTFTGTIQDPLDELNGEKVSVRLLGVDTPETVHPTKKPEYYGKEASSYLRSQIINKNIELLFDTDKVDLYGRWLGYIYVNGEFIQESIIKNGYSKVEEVYPFSKKSEFLQYQDLAKAKGLGIWINKSQLALKEEENNELQIDSTNDTSEEQDGLHSILLSEVHAAIEKGSNEEFMDLEWVEVWNPSLEEVDLSGWTLAKTEKKTVFYTFAEGSIIQPNGYMLLFSLQKGLKLNDGGSEIQLFASGKLMIDHVKYPKLKAGESYAQIDSNAGVSEWCVTAKPTPGRVNECAKIQKKVASKSTKKSSVIALADPLESKIVYETILPDEEEGGSGEVLWSPLQGMLMQADLDEPLEDEIEKTFDWSALVLYFAVGLLIVLLIRFCIPLPVGEVRRGVAN